jgi:hypothetical protein
MHGPQAIHDKAGVWLLGPSWMESYLDGEFFVGVFVLELGDPRGKGTHHPLARINPLVRVRVCVVVCVISLVVWWCVGGEVSPPETRRRRGGFAECHVSLPPSAA